MNKKWWESEKKENPDYIDHIYVTKKEVTSAQLLDTNGNEIETFIHMGIEQYKINGKFHDDMLVELEKRKKANDAI